MGWVMMTLAIITEGLDSYLNKRGFSIYNMMVLFSLFTIAVQLIKIESNNEK